MLHITTFSGGWVACLKLKIRLTSTLVWVEIKLSWVEAELGNKQRYCWHWLVGVVCKSIFAPKPTVGWVLSSVWCVQFCPKNINKSGLLFAAAILEYWRGQIPNKNRKFFSGRTVKYLITCNLKYSGKKPLQIELCETHKLCYNQASRAATQSQQKYLKMGEKYHFIFWVSWRK